MEPVGIMLFIVGQIVQIQINSRLWLNLNRVIQYITVAARYRKQDTRTPLVALRCVQARASTFQQLGAIGSMILTRGGRTQNLNHLYHLSIGKTLYSGGCYNYK